MTVRRNRPWLWSAALVAGLAAVWTLIVSAGPPRRRFIESDWEAGRALYLRECATCHGPDGRGDTEEGRRLEILDHTKILPERTDEQMLGVIRNGTLGMRGYSFPAKQERQLLDFLGTMGDIGAGYKVYRQFCLACHGPDGKAQTASGKALKAADLTVVIPQRRDADLVRVIAQGQKSMPAWRDVLSEKEQAQVLRYIKTLPPARRPEK